MKTQKTQKAKRTHKGFKSLAIALTLCICLCMLSPVAYAGAGGGVGAGVVTGAGGGVEDGAVVAAQAAGPSVSITGPALVKRSDSYATYTISVSEIPVGTTIIEIVFRVDEGFFAGSDMSVLNGWIVVNDSGYNVLSNGFLERSVILLNTTPGGVPGDYDIIELELACKNAIGITKVEIVDARSATIGEVTILEITGPAVTEFTGPSISIIGPSTVGYFDTHATYRISVSDVPNYTSLVNFTIRVEEAFFEGFNMRLLTGWIVMSDSGYTVSGNGFFERTVSLGFAGGLSGGDADILEVEFACKNVVGITNVELFDVSGASPVDAFPLNTTGSAVTKFVKPSICVTGTAEVSNLNPNAVYRVSVSDLLYATGVVRFALRIEDGFFANSQINVLSDWVEVSDSGDWVLDGKHWTKAFELGKPGGTGASWRGDILEVAFDCEDARGSTMVEVINAVASTPAITDMPLIVTGYAETEFFYFSKYDVNRDTVVSSADLAAAMFFFAKHNIDVDWAEFVAFEKSALESLSVSAERCDVNDDSVVDIQDCILISINIE